MENQLGTFLAEKRESCEISLREAAKHIGLSPQFLHDIEKGTRMFPIVPERIEAIRNLYQLDDNDFRDFITKISQSRNEVALDLSSYITERKYVTSAIRSAISLGATKEDWESFSQKLIDNAHLHIINKDSKIEVSAVELEDDWLVKTILKSDSVMYEHYKIMLDKKTAESLAEKIGSYLTAVNKDVLMQAFKNKEYFPVLHYLLNEDLGDTKLYVEEINEDFPELPNFKKLSLDDESFGVLMKKVSEFREKTVEHTEKDQKERDM